MKNIVILASGGGSNFQSFIDAVNNKILNAKIVGLICNKPNAGCFEKAKKASIPALLLDHKSFSSREAFDQDLAEKIEDLSPDLVILAGFMRILTTEFTERFAGKLLNIHPSLLPKYTGLNTHQRAIDAGDSKAGATVHFVTAELDGGPAIIQAEVDINDNDKADDLAARVLSKEHKIYPLAAQWFCEGRLKLINNKVMLDEKPVPPTGIIYSEQLS